MLAVQLQPAAATEVCRCLDDWSSDFRRDRARKVARCEKCKLRVVGPEHTDRLKHEEARLLGERQRVQERWREKEVRERLQELRLERVDQARLQAFEDRHRPEPERRPLTLAEEMYIDEVVENLVAALSVEQKSAVATISVSEPKPTEIPYCVYGLRQALVRALAEVTTDAPKKVLSRVVGLYRKLRTAAVRAAEPMPSAGEARRYLLDLFSRPEWQRFDRLRNERRKATPAYKRQQREAKRSKYAAKKKAAGLDVRERLVLEVVRGRQDVAMTEIVAALDVPASKSVTVFVGCLLREHGWRRVLRRHDGARSPFYVRTTPKARVQGEPLA